MKALRLVLIACGLVYGGGNFYASDMSENPLLKESTLPYEYPHFDQIKEEHFVPAMEQGMALAAADVLVKAAAGKVPNSLGMLLYGSMPFAAGVVWCLIDRKNVAAATITTKGVVLGLGVGVMFATVTFCMYAAFRVGGPDGADGEDGE